MTKSNVFALEAKCFLIAVSTIASVASAQQPTIDCNDWTTKGLSQLEMNACAWQDAKTTQEKLAQLLKELRKRFATNGLRLNQLEETQKSWERFVQEDCNLESASYEGGSMQPMVEALCRANATTQRIERLRLFL
jgi:uncharacterized protein YecT (DUF1311 family)